MVGVVMGMMVAAVAAAPALDLGKGAIIGAMVIGAAFLAGVAVLRKSAAAGCGLLLLSAASVLQAIWLGVVPRPSPTVFLLVEAVFAAAALLFLSATIRMVRSNQLMGGVLFAGALSILGVGVLNALLGGQAAGLQRMAVIGVGGVALTLSGLAGAKGDIGARLVLPGAVLVAAAPFLFGAGGAGAFSLAPQALFAMGVLLAGLVALADLGHARPLANLGDATASFTNHSPAHHATFAQEAVRVSENRLAEVLDYSGIAVWDWERRGGNQSFSFARLMGADCDGDFTPDALREFVHKDDAARVEDRIFGADRGDGSFDETIRLVGGRKVRMRGARAVHKEGGLERIVVFLEDATMKPLLQKAEKPVVLPNLAPVVAPPPKVLAPEPPPAKVAAIEPEAGASFRPVVSFEGEKICGAAMATSGGALSPAMMNAAARHASERVRAGDKSYFVIFRASVAQAGDHAFIEAVKTAVGDYKLPNAALVVEMPSDDLSAKGAADILRNLRNAGAAVACGVDDVSAVADLRKYAIDYLRLDKSLIDDLDGKSAKKKLAAALSRLDRDLAVIADGVESKEVAAIAKSAGCRLGSGNLFGAEPDSRLSAPDLATIEVVKADPETIVLDRSMSAKSHRSRRRLFARA